MNSTETTPHLRSSIHYIAAVLTMGIYGGQVCPLVETLRMGPWLIELILIFGFFFVLHIWALIRVIQESPLQRQVSRQFFLELTHFMGAGIAITIFNKWAYGFPGIESGLKMLLGTAALGFFIATDLALARERIIARELLNTGQKFSVDRRYFPMTIKFSIVAMITALTVSSIVLLVVLKDLGWMMDFDTIDAKSARISVIKEISFVTLLFLLHIFNLIYSYAKNLNLAIQKENTALIRVTRGHLDTRVIVSSNDEFGVMALYTNQMIAMLQKNTRQIQQTRDATIIALASLAETRDNATGDHILRTQNYVRALAHKLRNHPQFATFLEDETIHLVYKSAPLHDIGKVGIPDNILLKPGRLTDEEFKIMKKHAILGKEALEKAAVNLKDNNFLKIAQEIACSHHEKWDGTGYPHGLKGNAIPIPARLMALADVYDALISKRVYKEAFSHEKAKSILIKGRGSHFDPIVLDAFMAIEETFVSIAAKFSEAGKQN